MPDAPAIVPSAPLWGLLLATLSSCVAAVALGVVYGYLFARVPYAYLVTIAGTVAFGQLVGIVTERLLRVARVRQRRIVRWSPLVVGTLGFYSAWVTWLVHNVVDRHIAILAWRPLHVLHRIQMMDDSPTWRVFGWAPPYYDLWSMWAFELIVFYAALDLAAVRATERLESRK